MSFCQRSFPSYSATNHFWCKYKFKASFSHSCKKSFGLFGCMCLWIFANVQNSWEYPNSAGLWYAILIIHALASSDISVGLPERFASNSSASIPPSLNFEIQRRTVLLPILCLVAISAKDTPSALYRKILHDQLSVPESFFYKHQSVPLMPPEINACFFLLPKQHLLIFLCFGSFWFASKILYNTPNNETISYN